MKGKFLKRALELVCEQAVNQVDFFVAMIEAGYGASSSKIDYEYKKQKRLSEIKKSDAENLREKKKRFSNFMGQMKRDGLIKESSGKGLVISDKGRKKLTKLNHQLPNKNYQVDKQKSLTIISFDIPEKLRRKRDWLREVVRNLGFEMIHRSVWIGKVKVPTEFIQDLENLKILENVEIFEINKMGSLEKFNKS